MADLTIAEAAVRLGISKEALRTRVRRQQVTAYKDADGQWRVVVPDDTPGPGSGRGQDAASDARTYDADAVISILRDQLAEKDRQISELHVLLQTSQRNEQRLLAATIPDAEDARGSTVRPAERATPYEDRSEANASPEPLQRENEASARARPWWRRFFFGQE